MLIYEYLKHKLQILIKCYYFEKKNPIKITMVV